jgi:hypothetical protein
MADSILYLVLTQFQESNIPPITRPKIPALSSYGISHNLPKGELRWQYGNETRLKLPENKSA